MENTYSAKYLFIAPHRNFKLRSFAAGMSTMAAVSPYAVVYNVALPRMLHGKKEQRIQTQC
jgi:hypothetical protein